MTPRTDEQKPPKPRDWVFQGFLFGVLAGVAVGLGVLAWHRFVGPRPSKDYPQIYVGFWGMVGGLLGLVAGILGRFRNWGR